MPRGTYENDSSRLGRYVNRSNHTGESMLFRHISGKCAKRRAIRYDGWRDSQQLRCRVKISPLRKSMPLAFRIFLYASRLCFSDVEDGNRTIVRTVLLALADLVKRAGFLPLLCWIYVGALCQPVVAPTEFYRTVAPMCCGIEVPRR